MLTPDLYSPHTKLWIRRVAVCHSRKFFGRLLCNGRMICCCRSRNGWRRCVNVKVESAKNALKSVITQTLTHNTLVSSQFRNKENFFFSFLRNPRNRSNMRRLSSAVALRSAFSAAALLRLGSPSPAVAMTTSVAAVALRHQSSGNRSNVPVQQLPPAFDIPRWNDDKSKGYCLRVSYAENCVLLTYIAQQNDLPQTPAGAETSAPQTRLPLRGDRLVTVYLPNVYIARFLAVMEGTLDKCEIASRQTSGTFSALPEPYHFRLVAKSNVNLQDSRKLEWTTDFDPAHTIMLQRFFTQALHFNSGFAK